jgi:serine/threonine protein kinase
VARQALQALEALHQMGIFHRDLKAANLMVARKRNLGGIDLMDQIVSEFGCNLS